MKIAIIGATGMIGHHTAKAVLERGHELYVIHRASSNLTKIADLSYQSAIADLDDAQSLAAALKQVDAVINCAGYYPTVPVPWQEEVTTAMAQMENFYHACKQCNLQKIVYLGAAIALNKAEDGQMADADCEYIAQPTNKNPYLQVKWAMDELAKKAAKKGLPVVIAIPSMTFGEYDFGPTTGQLLMEIANESLPGFIAGDRNVIYAGDAGRGLVLACERGRVGQRYLFTGENITMSALIPMIAKLANVVTPKEVPLIAAKILSKVQALKYQLFAGKTPKISATAITVISAGQFLNGEKAQKELGFKAEMSVENSIIKTLRWFKEQKYIG